MFKRSKSKKKVAKAKKNCLELDLSNMPIDMATFIKQLCMKKNEIFLSDFSFEKEYMFSISIFCDQWIDQINENMEELEYLDKEKKNFKEQADIVVSKIKSHNNKILQLNSDKFIQHILIYANKLDQLLKEYESVKFLHLSNNFVFKEKIKGIIIPTLESNLFNLKNALIELKEKYPDLINSKRN